MQDRQTFEEIYLNYYPILVVYGKTITQDDQLVEDTIQELFLTLWKKGDELTIKKSFENYLLVSFRNNLIRKLKRPPSIPMDIIALAEEENDNREEREEKLRKLIEELPTHQQEVIYLRYYKNKSYHEIAEILGINYQVARNFAYRAIKFLKKHIEQLYMMALSPLLFFASAIRLRT